MSLAFGQCFFRKFCLFIKNFVTMRVGCLTSDVVLFSVVALKTLDISQGSVATHLRCGGIFSNSIITDFLLDSEGKIISKIS